MLNQIKGLSQKITLTDRSELREEGKKNPTPFGVGPFISNELID
jgi:hypothetical protein